MPAYRLHRHPQLAHNDTPDPTHDHPGAGAPAGPQPTIWTADAPSTPETLSHRLAHLVLDELTRPGDLVIDLDNNTAFAQAADKSGRRHRGLDGYTDLSPLHRNSTPIHLLLMHWPGSRTNPRVLLATCRALVHTRGHVVIAVTVQPHDRTAHLTALTGAADAVGLQVVRHVVVIDANPADDVRPANQRHRPSAAPHTDLLILTVPAGHHD